MSEETKMYINVAKSTLVEVESGKKLTDLFPNGILVSINTKGEVVEIFDGGGMVAGKVEVEKDE